MTFVLDNSVAMRWCFENAAHPYADGILNRLAAGEDALVPVLWFYEASAVLAREQNRGTLAAPKADQFCRVEGAADRPTRKAPRGYSTSASAGARSSADLLRCGVSGMALRHGLPLATLDDELIRASKAAGVTVL